MSDFPLLSHEVMAKMLERTYPCKETLEGSVVHVLPIKSAPGEHVVPLHEIVQTTSFEISEEMLREELCEEVRKDLAKRIEQRVEAMMRPMPDVVLSGFFDPPPLRLPQPGDTVTIEGMGEYVAGETTEQNGVKTLSLLPKKMVDLQTGITIRPVTTFRTGDGDGARADNASSVGGASS